MLCSNLVIREVNCRLCPPKLRRLAGEPEKVRQRCLFRNGTHIETRAMLPPRLHVSSGATTVSYTHLTLPTILLV
eukprot:1847006-Pyramimonas_sp.AAC.1